MPLPTLPPEDLPPQPAPKQLQAELTTPSYKHSLIDVKETPFASLLTHVEGSSWTVDYYSQILGDSESVSAFQPSQLPPYQQYLLIHGYELKLQGSLSISQDTETGNMEASGTALMYPHTKPNVGDAFLAEVGDGQVGQFTITSSVRRSMFKEAVYEVNFELSRIATENVVNAIGVRVVKEAWFKRDFLTYGQNPILVDSQVEDVTKIGQYHATLLNEWMQSFYSRRYATVLVPGQSTGPVYDPYVVKMLLKVFHHDEHPTLKKIKELNTTGFREMEDFNLWDIVINLDESLFPLVMQKFAFLDRARFPVNPLLNSVYYSGIDYVVYPLLTIPNVDSDYSNIAPATSTSYDNLNDGTTYLPSIIPDNILGDNTGEPSPIIDEIALFHPVLVDDYYVLSQYFYTKAAAGQSALELLVNDVVANRAIDLTKLYDILEARHLFGRLEKFYYYPLLLILLKVAMRQV